ncbi:MAG: hypothetical protein JNL52_13505 [Flavobacteriales bacterium]|nr:hypothetical protein [Flavobacteriales bacterium]
MIRSHMSPCQVAAAARKDVGQLLRHVEEKHAELARSCPKVGNDRLERRSGHFTTRKGLQWVYVITATDGRITIYPLLWYATTTGICALQVDAEGPASFFQQHVMDRYIKRYLREGDLRNALREFHLKNYDKVYLRDTYKGDRDSYAAVIDDGYVVGEYQQKAAVLYFRTFYDQRTGHRRFGHLRTALGWRQALNKTRFEHAGRRQTPHEAWGRGYVRMAVEWSLAA